MHSPTLNDPRSPFHHPVDEVYFVALRKHMIKFLNLLLLQREVFGDAHLYFLTEEDEAFNKSSSLLFGTSKLRITMLKEVKASKVFLDIVEIHAEHIFREHSLKCKYALSNPWEYFYCLPREIALLSKLMKIDAVDEEKFRSLSEKEKLTALGVAPYDYSKILIGMSFKDMMYCYALIKDSGMTVGTGSINFKIYGAILRKDPGFATTARANLENLLNRIEVLKKLGVEDDVIYNIETKIEELLRATPKISKKWKGPWWSS